MRRAIVDAEVGDDVLDGDPTVRRLEARVAELLGCDAALFFPSGTMANQSALMTLGRPGTEFIAHEEAHVVDREKCAAAMFSGMQPRLMRGAARATLDAFRAAVRPRSPHLPQASLLCIENTHNSGGGVVTPAAELDTIASAARAFGLGVFLDGARLWNAHVATGTPLASFARAADLTMVSFSKGLGAPVGAALAGRRALIDEARDARRRFGGGMRQSGVLAAACLYGIAHNIGRLADDHSAAARFASIVAEANGASVVPPDTNIVMVTLPAGVRPGDVERAANERGVGIVAWDATRIRAVTHLDAAAADAERAAVVIRDVINAIQRQGPTA